MARLTTLGELATSITHEINQPLSAIVMNGNACLRWLANERPNPDEAREAAQRIVRDGIRTCDIIRSIRALARKSGPDMTLFDINGAICKVLALMRSELCRHDVSIETDLSENLAPVLGDRVQLQQVILNLMMNGVEAMDTAMHRPRVLRLRSELGGPGTLVSRSRIRARGSRPKSKIVSSMRSSRRSQTARAWGCRFAGRSSTPMAAGSGYRRGPPMVPSSNLPCRSLPAWRPDPRTPAETRSAYATTARHATGRG